MEVVNFLSFGSKTFNASPLSFRYELSRLPVFFNPAVDKRNYIYSFFQEILFQLSCLISYLKKLETFFISNSSC